jgi:hypothetical protein
MSQKKMNDSNQYQEDMMNKMGMPIPIKSTESGTEQILQDIKDPISVIMLVCILCLPQIDSLLKNNVEVFKNEESLSIMGVLFKAVLAGVFFYIIKKFT